MMLFRKASKDDLMGIHALATASGTGITTLPKDLDLLQTRLKLSTTSFKRKVTSPTNEYYLFVLEDVAQRKIVGTSAIEAAAGFNAPFYSYKLSKRIGICPSLHRRNHYEVLILVNDNQGHSELCTLLLEPSYRVDGNGALLSRARLLFIANNRTRFSSTVFADMRGVADEKGQSPFWNQIGYHFFQMSFEEADRLTLSTNKQFIADLMPRNLIYVNLLSKEAQAVIGKPHPTAEKAMAILTHEGFRYNGYVDIFDGGPTLEAPCDQVLSIASSKPMSIEAIEEEVQGSPYLIANTSLDFRATISSIMVDKTITLSKDTADLLKVKKGDVLRIIPFSRTKTKGG